MRREVQRLFEGVKKDNVGPYAQYIVELARGKQHGITPAIILWTPDELDSRNTACFLKRSR